MSNKDTVYVQVAIDWTQTRQAMLALLNATYFLPPGITDQQLVNLRDACENARQRLREQSGAR